VADQSGRGTRPVPADRAAGQPTRRTTAKRWRGRRKRTSVRRTRRRTRLRTDEQRAQTANDAGFVLGFMLALLAAAAAGSRPAAAVDYRSLEAAGAGGAANAEATIAEAAASIGSAAAWASSGRWIRRAGERWAPNQRNTTSTSSGAVRGSLARRSSDANVAQSMSSSSRVVHARQTPRSMRKPSTPEAWGRRTAKRASRGSAGRSCERRSNASTSRNSRVD